MTPDDRDLLRVGALELGIGLPDATMARFSLVVAELVRWNERLNLTSLRTVRDIVTKHFIDSLTVAPLLPECATVLDIGSGAGFPSIPLKLVRPDITVVSVDSVRKKINFQRNVENLPASMQGRFEIVIARALTELGSLCRLGAPFLSDTGKLIAMKGGRWKDEIDGSGEDLGRLGLVVNEVREIKLPMSGDDRALIILSRAVSSVRKIGL
jgi:16S rRNA (guanine527-N7)-methyltransferase